MFKNIARIVTIFVFLVCIFGAVLLYGGQNIASVKEYSLLTFYATSGVISLLAFIYLVRVIRNKFSTKPSPEEMEAIEYWKTNLKRVKNSKLASFGNPFKKYPSFILIRNIGGDELNHGIPVMGVDYRQDLPNILVGDALFLIDLPYTKIYEYLGFVKSLGKDNIKGILLEDGEPSMFDKDGVASLIKHINLHSVGRRLPVYMYVPDRGDMKALRDDGSLVARAIKMAPLGCFCDPKDISGAIDGAKQLLLQNLAILRNSDLYQFEEFAQRHSVSWKNIENALDRAISRFHSLSNSHGIYMRGLLYGEGIVRGRLDEGAGIQRALLGDVGTVDSLNKPRFSLMPYIGYLFGLLALVVWMSYSFVSGREDLTALAEQLASENSSSDLNDNLSRYNNYVVKVDGLTTGFRDIFRITDDIRVKMKEKYVSQYGMFLVKPYIEMLNSSRFGTPRPDFDADQIAALLHALKLTAEGNGIAQIDSSLLLRKMVELHTVIVDDTTMQHANVTFRKYLQWIDADDRLALHNELGELFIDAYITASRDTNSLLSLLKIRTTLTDIQIQSSAVSPAAKNGIYISGVFSNPAVSELNNLISELEQVSDDLEFRKLIEQQKSDYFSAYEMAWKRAFFEEIKVSNTLEASLLEPGLVYLAKNSSLFHYVLSLYAENVAAVTRNGEIANSVFAQDLMAWQRLMDPDYRKQLMSNGLLSGISDKSAIAVNKIKNIMGSGSNAEARYKLEKSLLPMIMQREKLMSELAKVSLGEGNLSYNTIIASSAEAMKSTSSSMPKESINKLLWLDQRILDLWSYQASLDTGVKDLLATESRYLIKAVMHQAGKYIQDKWQSNVLFELSNISGWDRSKLISGRDGLVWKFKKEYLEPFVMSGGSRRYVEKYIGGVKLGLNESLLSLLGKGGLDEKLLEEELSFVISTLPTSVNRTSVELPELTTIELNCAKGRQRIENENFPLDATFYWTPDVCNDVELKVFFSNGFVTKKYSGYAGILEFFNDFKTGKKQFSRQDFSGSDEIFSSLSLKIITVRFRIKSSVSIDRLMSLYSTNVPDQIIEGSGGEIYASN